MAKKKKVKRKADETDSQPGFEESLAELETIVGELEGGELGLGDALERYERGIGRLKQCHAQLQRASRKIELLSGVDAAGNPITEPFDDEELDGFEQKKGARAKRRAGGRGTKGSSGVDDGPGLF